MVEQIRSAGGHGALNTVDADDAIGDHHVPVQVRIKLATVGLDGHGRRIAQPPDRGGFLPVPFVPGAPVCDPRHELVSCLPGGIANTGQPLLARNRIGDERSNTEGLRTRQCHFVACVSNKANQFGLGGNALPHGQTEVGVG